MQVVTVLCRKHRAVLLLLLLLQASWAPTRMMLVSASATG
jgi:hypothetical protein